MPEFPALKYDLVVIGSGPGGYVAARRGAQLGLKTAIVEKDEHLGGTCSLRGCLPTKALLHAAEVWRMCSKGARAFGIDVPAATFDWAQVQKRRQQVTAKGSEGVGLLLKNAGVDVVHGHGRLKGQGRVQVATPDGIRALEAGKIILATGSAGTRLPGMKSDGQRILNSEQLLEIDHVPDSMVVVGAGAVGLELASIMQSFGCRVTLVELMGQVLPLEDPEVAEVVEKGLERQKMTVKTGTKALGVEKTDRGVVVTLAHAAGGEEEKVAASCLLVAVGRKPVTKDVGLDTVETVIRRGGFVQTDAMMETALPGLYAIGDIVSTPQRAHLACREALVAAHHAAGQPLPPIHYHRVPSGVFGNPEVASVGLKEAEALAAGYEVKTGRFPFSALGKAAILSEPHGFVKVVSDAESAKVLGVHMVGPRVTELLGEAVAALGFEADLGTWSEVMHAHPTLGEAVGEAVAAAGGLPLLAT